MDLTLAVLTTLMGFLGVTCEMPSSTPCSANCKVPNLMAPSTTVPVNSRTLGATDSSPTTPR